MTKTLETLLVNRPASEPVDQGLYVKLTASELEILDFLAEQAGQARNVFIRQMIIREAKENRMNNAQKAQWIYREVFGHVDNKYFQNAKEAEIQDWLEAGDPEDMTLAELADEWREFDAAEVAERS